MSTPTGLAPLILHRSRRRWSLPLPLLVASLTAVAAEATGTASQLSAAALKSQVQRNPISCLHGTC